MESNNKISLNKTEIINNNTYKLNALFNNINADFKQNSTADLDNLSKELKSYKDKILTLEKKLNKYKKL